MDRPRALIVVTVYNGASVVPWCLRSAARASTLCERAQCDVLVLDDASPEPGLSEEFEQLCAELEIQYYRSPRNLGIPRNVNVGLLHAVHAGYDYVLIANSDVLFGAKTLDQLIDAVDSDPMIGSATAWSNNVSIYTLPNDDPDRWLSDQTFVDWLGDAMIEEFGDSPVDVPVGISFCILIPTKALQTVGLMDPVFGRGYCEETDWTLRSKALGYRITLAPSAFVYHRGQGSNLDAGIVASGHTSVPAHERIIDHRYPLFREQVSAFCNSEIHDLMRNGALRSVMKKAAQENGYRIDIGIPVASPPTVGPLVTFEKIWGSLNPVAQFRGFRMELPHSPNPSDVVGSIVDFFGFDPIAVRLAEHNILSHEVAGALEKSGMDVDIEIGYPLHV